MAPPMTNAAWTVGAIAACGSFAAVTWAARQVTSPTYRRRYDIIPLAISDNEIEFAATRRTTAPGEFGLQLATGGSPAIIGPVILNRNGRVTRRLLYRPAGLSLGSKGRWSGIVSVGPTSAAADVANTVISTPAGPAPAWAIDCGASRWAIHVHGQGSDRRQTLRGVDTATALGLSSLVISYRNDGEGPQSLDRRSHLGESEWLDLEAALRFISERGGRDCVVFGWSLGATMALTAVQNSPVGRMIKGIVMISPVLSWEDALRANAAHKGLPQFLGSLVVRFLAGTWLSRLAGLDERLNVRESDQARFNRVLNIPVLILHNKNDWSVPYETSARFAEAHKDLVELVPFDCSGHTQEWNSDRVGWDLAVRRWYGKFFQPNPAEGKADRQTANEIEWG